MNPNKFETNCWVLACETHDEYISAVFCNVRNYNFVRDS